MTVKDLINYPVTLTQDLLWGDMDAFEHINNAVYFRYFEDARMAYFQKCGVMDLMQTENVGPILANTSCNFRAPLRFPDRIHIGARVNNFEGKRFNMEYIVYSETLQRVAADGIGLIIYYDYNHHRSCNVPKKIVDALCNIKSN